MSDPIQHITETLAGVNALRKAELPAPVLDAHTLDVVEAVIIDCRSKTKHTFDAAAMTRVLNAVKALRTPDGPVAA